MWALRMLGCGRRIESCPSSLSHYRLLEKIGEGGMGVVWRAEDTRLGRELVVDLAGGGLTGIAVRTQPRPAVVATRALIAPGESHNEILSVTALPGDRLLLMEAGDDEKAPTRIHLVQGWRQKLSRR